MKECFFCNSEEGILIVKVKDNKNKCVREICEVCFNQARYCIDGLSYKGKIIFLC